MSRTQPQATGKTHHNSPQTPKTCFIHSEVVHPLLLTLPSPGRTPDDAEKEIGLIAQKKKAPSSKGWGFKNMPAIT
jgi:hypothetical protein